MMSLGPNRSLSPPINMEATPWINRLVEAAPAMAALPQPKSVIKELKKTP